MFLDLTTAAPDDLLRIDAVTLLLATLVTLVALAVLPYAHRNLRGDRHGRGVTAALALVFAASGAMVLLADPLAQAAAWSVATIGVLVALRLGGGRAAVRRPAVWLIATDVLVWASVLLAPGTAAAVLLVAAAIIRAAGVPAHGWLLDALRAPTPVSAALHGGVVNGGAILVILQLPALEAGAAPLVVAAVFGAIAIVVGGAGLAARPDIKGKLVMSTVAQLGFSMLCIGLGLWAAALLHLVAHGWYKSARFLASGDGVDRRAAARRAPAPARPVLPRAGAALGALTAAAAVIAGVLVSYPGAASLGGAVVITMIGLATGTAAARLVGSASSRGELAGRLGLVVVMAGAIAVALGLLNRMLAPALAPTVAPPVASLALAAAAALAVVALVTVRRAAAGSSFERALLAGALALGAAPRSALDRGSSRRRRGAVFVASAEAPAATHRTPSAPTRQEVAA
ncbi:MAG TPA: proton-conducting transporter membrane subunit [Microcella sp.]|nr:proton-conducting transporter membrane subunit [Microcella sp.]